MRITEHASNKISELYQCDLGFRVSANGNMKDGFTVDLVPCSESSSFDVTINTNPLVIASVSTITVMASKVLDYDEKENEFVVRERS